MKKQILKEYAWITIGTLILAMGMNQFLVPMKLSTGGIGSLGTMFLYLFEIPLSLTNLGLNAILFVLGYKFIGRAAVVKTLYGIVLFSLFLAWTAGLPVYREEIILCAVFGGLLCGTGVGLVVRCEGSTGGSDFAALILHRIFPHISVATLLLVLDCGIVILSGIVFGSITIVLYSLISLFVAAKVADVILTMGDVAKSVYILSGKCAEISHWVHTQLSRGVTGIYSRGMYKNKDAIMLLCVVSPKQLPMLVHAVKQIDESAFIIISDAREVIGEGFKA